MKKTITLTSRTLLLCGVVAFSACQQETKTEESTTTTTVTQPETPQKPTAPQTTTMMDMTHQNLAKMQQVIFTGDPDLDFATLMIAHHEGAITMAEMELQQGSDSVLQKLARKSMETNKAERDQLEKLANVHKPVKGDPAVSKNLLGSLEKMMANMDHGMLGKTDHQFANLMSLHHQSGIDMTDTYLRSGKAADLKELARKIKAGQQKEKKQLDDWLQKNQPE